jgi:flagellar motor switch protein FliG
VLLNLARMEESTATCWSSSTNWWPLPELLDTQSTSVEGIRQTAEILNRLPGNRAADGGAAARTTRRWCPRSNCRCTTSSSSATRPNTLTRILEDVPMEQWAIALKGAEPSMREAVLKTMPRRQAQSFEDMMRRAGPVPLSRIEQTRQEIMATVKGLADAGESRCSCLPKR